MKINYEDGSVVLSPVPQDFSATPGYLPYLNLFPSYERIVPVGVPTTIRYEKPDDGCYIYSNNPEMLAPEDIGQAILQNKNLHGSVMFTFEHSNHTGIPLWFGYQLRNEGTSDAVVLVTNAGLQVDGEWLGQRSWSDYFSTKFTLPADYFRADGSENPMYVGCDYLDYTPPVFRPMTMTIPAGKYAYVLGGTTEDAYAHVNVGGTADRPVLPGKCSNGAVKFDILRGNLTGTFLVYSDLAQARTLPPEQGMIDFRDGKNYSAQYKGIEHTSGVIISQPVFAVDDATPAGKLAVTYENARDPDCDAKTKPYQAYRLQRYTLNETDWLTALNPNSSHNAIGTDMMTFTCPGPDGKAICIDNAHADGSGHPANTGNWMVQYTDNFVFANAGTRPRKFRIYKKGATSGALFVMTRNADGAVLDAKMICHPYSYADGHIPDGVDRSLLTKVGNTWWYQIDGVPYCNLTDEKAFVWEVTVQPEEAEAVTVDSLILGNSCGGILHWVTVD